MTQPPPRPGSHVAVGVRSVIGTMAQFVHDLVLTTTESAPEWLRCLVIPTGWHLVQVEGATLQPTRIAICGERSAGGWDGCDTVSLYSFAGSVSPQLITQTNDATLLDLGADSVVTHRLAGVHVDGSGEEIVAVRSSGYYTLADRRFWAQYSTYYADEDSRAGGVVLSHSVVVGADVRARLRGDITDLSDTLYSAFAARTDTVDDDAPTKPLPILEGDQDGS